MYKNAVDSISSDSRKIYHHRYLRICSYRSQSYSAWHTFPPMNCDTVHKKVELEKKFLSARRSGLAWSGVQILNTSTNTSRTLKRFQEHPTSPTTHHPHSNPNWPFVPLTFYVITAESKRLRQPSWSTQHRRYRTS